MNQKLTLKQIAKKAGVSPSLISQLLNGKARVSDQVRDKIDELLIENGYQPRYISSPFYFLVDLYRIEAQKKMNNILGMMNGLEKMFSDKKLNFKIEFLRATPIDQQLEKIIEDKPAGVIILADSPHLEMMIDFFSKKSLPIVQMGYDTEDSSQNAVVMDSFTGSYRAVKYLLNSGHQRIAMIRWTPGVAAINSNKKYAGYVAALADHNIEIDSQLIKIYQFEQTDPDWIPARELLNDLMDQPDPPTALFVDNSFISLSLVYPLAKDNGQLPRQLKEIEMIHFEDWSLDLADDILSKKLFYPKIDTKFISINWEDIGFEAAKLIIEQVKNRDENALKILKIVPSLFTVKGSQRTRINF